MIQYTSSSKARSVEDRAFYLAQTRSCCSLVVTAVYSRALLILIAFLLGGIALYLSREGIDVVTLAIAGLSGIAFLAASLVAKRR